MTAEATLDAALALLDAGGGGALTMRALGAALGVNPMTIHHHFGGRDGVVTALADRVYAGVVAPPGPDPRDRLDGLLRAYRAAVRRHPALMLEVFGSRTAFPSQARRISASLVDLLVELGLPPSRARLWRDVLVDYLHGAALAEAMGGPVDRAPGSLPEPIDPGLDPLAALIAAMSSAEGRGRA